MIEDIADINQDLPLLMEDKAFPRAMDWESRLP
jgi:hypothetical protein